MADFFLAALTCLLLAISLRVAIRFVFGGQQSNTIYLLFDILTRMMFAACLIFISVAFLTTSWLFWILIPFLIESIVLFFITGRRARRYSLLNLLTISTDRGLPLGNLVEVWNKSHFGRVSRQETKLVELLASGTPASAALAATPNALPGTTSVFARAGALSGSIGPAFRAAVQQEAHSFAMRKRLRDSSFYLVLLPPVVLFILTFFMIKLIPAFRRIFEDFGLQLPLVTQTLIRFSADAGGILSLIFFPLLLVFFYLMWIVLGGSIRSRWTYRFQPGLSVLNQASVLKLLSVVVRQRQSMQPALALLASDHPHRQMRVKLGQVLKDMEGGFDWCESLRRNKLIGKSHVALLHSAQRLGNLPWALEQTSKSLTQRAILKQEALTRVLGPTLIILMGICVGFIVIALFYPLVTLIQLLT